MEYLFSRGESAYSMEGMLESRISVPGKKCEVSIANQGGLLHGTGRISPKILNRPDERQQETQAPKTLSREVWARWCANVTRGQDRLSSLGVQPHPSLPPASLACLWLMSEPAPTGTALSRLFVCGTAGLPLYTPPHPPPNLRVASSLRF